MTKKEATDKANKLVSKLKGNWKPRVWENLGWHYCANLENGSVSVYPRYSSIDDTTYYHAMVGREIGSFGSMPCEWSMGGDHFKDPQESVDKVLNYIKNLIESNLNLINTNIELVRG